MKNTDRPTSPTTTNIHTALHTAPDKTPGTPLRTHRRVSAHRATHLAIASLLGLGLVACGGQASSVHEPHADTPPSATDALRPDAPTISTDTPSTPHTPDATAPTPTPAPPGSTVDKRTSNPATLCVTELAAMPPCLPAPNATRCPTMSVRPS